MLLPCHIERKSLPTDGQLDLSFYRSMWQSLVTQAPQGDTIVAKTDPPLTSIIAMVAARRNGAQLVNWIQVYLSGNRRGTGRAIHARPTHREA